MVWPDLVIWWLFLPPRGLPIAGFYITVQSGRRRMVRRLWASQGLGVSRLIRVRYANILLPRNLKPGASRLLTQQEQDALLAAVGMVER